MEQQLPARFGPYAVLGQIGHGGMGTVYRALDTRLRREVALKVLHRNLDVSGARERFLHEARVVSSLSHPNICTVFDIGEEGEDLFLVMELLQGRSVKEMVGSGPVAAEVIRDVALQIARALTAAHARSIVHRDIKPANLFMVDQGWSALQVKVLDFGLAKDAGRPKARKPRGLTRHGATVGTVEYMSPEQACGQELDGRSDLFSLGAVLYEMATGQVPFRGATSAIIYSELLNNDPVPPREANLDLPPDLDRIIQRLLKKDRQDRYQTASELVWELEASVPPMAQPSTRTQGVSKVSNAFNFPQKISVEMQTTAIPTHVSGEGIGPLRLAPETSLGPDSASRRYIRWKRSAGPDRLRFRIRLLLSCTLFLMMAVTMSAMLVKQPASVFTGTLQIVPLVNRTGNAALDMEPTARLQRKLETSRNFEVRAIGRNELQSEEKTPSRTDPAQSRRSPETSYVSGYISAVRNGYLVHVQVLYGAARQPLTTADEIAPSLEQIPDAVNRIADGIRQALGEKPAATSTHGHI